MSILDYEDKLPLQLLARAQKNAWNKGWRKKPLNLEVLPTIKYPQLGEDVVIASPGQEVGSGAHPSYRDPKFFNVLLEQVISVEAWTEKVDIARLYQRWPEIVGERIAANCTLESFSSQGVMVLRTRNLSWKTQLTALSAQLEAKLAQELGNNVVREIIIEGPHQKSWKHGTRSVPGRGPRDTYD